MNNNAMTKKSKMIIKTATGKARMGFRKTDGYIMSDERYYAELEKAGYKVEFTKSGVIISK
jgi:hypothetical protein